MRQQIKKLSSDDDDIKIEYEDETENKDELEFETKIFIIRIALEGYRGV